MNNFLHKYAKYIAALLAAVAAGSVAMGWLDESRVNAVIAILTTLGLGYLLPSPLPRPSAPDNLGPGN